MSGGPPPPWNGLRAAFYLVALILLIQTLGVMVTAAYCMLEMKDAIAAGKFECNKDGRLTELLNIALTTALAFAMAFLNKDDKK
jgi:hypothetical protein